MPGLLTLVIAAGLVPLVVAVARLAPGGERRASRPSPGSVLLATLAFNLTFFWQELGLAGAKALTPGLSAILYHNDHAWTGTAATAELLQASGAIATLASGLAFTVILASNRRLAPPWRIFVFWMAFEGLFQSASQFAIGTILPGNDVGRALGWLGLGPMQRAFVLLLAFAAMAGAGRALAAWAPAGLAPRSDWRTRDVARAFGTTGAAVVLLSIPFRIPRDAVEVVAIPAIVNLIGFAWLTVGITSDIRSGIASVRRFGRQDERGPIAIAVPAALLIALLLFFQVVLRPGVRL
jgi:hypothetical protein